MKTDVRDNDHVSRAMPYPGISDSRRFQEYSIHENQMHAVRNVLPALRAVFIFPLRPPKAYE